MHPIIFDLIATFISKVITRALPAPASAWFTVGASPGVFIAGVVAGARIGREVHRRHLEPG